MLRNTVVAALLLLTVAQVSFAQWRWTPATGRLVRVSRLPKETAELQVEYARQLLLEGELRKAWSETEKFDDYYANTPEAADNQLLRGEIRLAQGKYLKAAQELQSVISSYPESDLFDKVIELQYEVANGLFEKGLANQEERFKLFRNRPFDQAILVYGMVIDNQPFKKAAGEAQYRIGLCHFTMKEYVEAAFEYRQVIENYANSDWVKEASYGLTQCYYRSAQGPNYDQTPSLLTIDAIDGFKEQYPGDPHVADLDVQRVEMREQVAEQRLMTAKFYAKRRKEEAARLSYSVVVDQFGETGAASSAREWLASNPG